jgi:ribosome-binding ATPase YchF (GTP1/OBG family)
VIKLKIEIVDIAGIVKGASEGAGLGNKVPFTMRWVAVTVLTLCCSS